MHRMKRRETSSSNQHTWTTSATVQHNERVPASNWKHHQHSRRWEVSTDEVELEPPSDPEAGSQGKPTGRIN